MTSRFGPPVAEARPYQLKVTDRVQSLRDEWLALGERVRHPFATCDWLSLWWRHFGRPRHRLTLICAPGSDGQLLGVVPWYRSSVARLRILRSVGHGPSGELGPVIPADSPLSGPELRQQMLPFAGRWDVFLGEECAAPAGSSRWAVGSVDTTTAQCSTSTVSAGPTCLPGRAPSCVNGSVGPNASWARTTGWSRTRPRSTVTSRPCSICTPRVGGGPRHLPTRGCARSTMTSSGSRWPAAGFGCGLSSCIVNLSPPGMAYGSRARSAPTR